MKNGKDWKGQNIPRIHKEFDGTTFAILLVLECLLDFDEDTVEDLLPSPDSYGWEDNLTNNLVWANNAYRAVDIEPDFSRYGCLPSWFPKEDRQGHLLSNQGQVNRFLYLLDYAYGGLPDDHTRVNPRSLATAILELHASMGEYVSREEGDHREWEKADE